MNVSPAQAQHSTLEAILEEAEEPEHPANGKARGPYGRHTEAEKQAAIVLAVEHGVPQAAAMMGVPERSLRGWLKGAGGLAAIREVSEAACFQAMCAASVAVSNALRRKAEADELSGDQLIRAFIALIKTSAVFEPTPQPQPTAQAAAVIRLEEYTEVPRPHSAQP